MVTHEAKPGKNGRQHAPKKPAPVRGRVENIPDELRVLNRWVVWTFTLVQGKWTKVPYQVNGRNAKSSDSATWTQFLDACAACRRDGRDGIGIVLGKLVPPQR
jgi:primase-polymerase (primpol)-like protein